MLKHTLHLTYKLAKRIVITVVGITVLLIGIIFIVTPGPAFVLIPAGLAILGLEFAWARHLLHQVQSGANQAINTVMGRRNNDANPPPGDNKASPPNPVVEPVADPTHSDESSKQSGSG